MHPNKYSALLLLFILLLGKTTLAKDHYVSPDGTASWNESTDIDSPCGLATANDNVVAGDIVYMLGGTYKGGQIRPGRSGAAGNPITYRRYNGQTVTISESNDPILLPGISHIVVHGINVRNCDYFLTMHDGGHNTIEFCTFMDMRSPYDRAKGFQVGPGASYNWIHNCIISGYGEYSGGQDRGDMLYIGSHNDEASHHNLVENNHLYWGGHNVVVMDGHHTILRNNYLHNEPWAPDENGEYHGNRIFAFRNSGSGEGHGYRNLIEGNRFCFSATGNDAADNTKAIQHLNRDCIYHGNMFYHIEGAGIHIVTNSIHPGPDSDNNYIYHNNSFTPDYLLLELACSRD